jgi:DNA-binding PucR family transcriptional regulator
VAGTRRVVRRGIAATLDALGRMAPGEVSEEQLGEEVLALDLDAAMPELVRAVRQLARSQARFPDLVRILRTIHHVFLDAWDEALTEVEPDPAALVDATRRSRRLSFVWTDALTQRLAQEFEREADRLARSGESRRLATVDALLAHEVHDDAERMSRQLGYDLRRHHVAMIAWGGHDDGPLGPRVERLAAGLIAELGADERPLIVPMTATVVQIWAGFTSRPDRERIAAVAATPRPDGISVAIGEPALGAAGFRQSFRTAYDAFQLALLTSRPPGELTTFENVRLAAAFSGDVPRLKRFVQRRLGELALDTDDAARLRATLKVFLDENRSRQAAAERLAIHSNTVGNRVRACLDVLGEDLGGRPGEVHVALAITELLGSAVLETPTVVAAAVST